jgi:hypothetical protein
MENWETRKKKDIYYQEKNVKSFFRYFAPLKITNIINESKEIESNQLSYEIRKLIDDYIEDIKTKGVNYNLYLRTKPSLVITYLEEIGYKVRPFRSNECIILKCLPNKENLIVLDFIIDYLELKCYLLNTKPH